MEDRYTEYDGDRSSRKSGDDHNQSGDHDQKQHQSFPVSFQTPTKQRSSVLASACSPTCEERIHYPIFNPHDPRHNPAIAPTSWPGNGYFSRTPSPQKPIRWVQELPGRSLRKARSGFLALTNGMKNRSVFWDRAAKRTIPGTYSICPPMQEQLSPCKGRSFPRTVSEASTEIDADFGVEIYRTCCNWSKPPSVSSWDGDEVTEVRLSSSLALVSPNTLSKMDLGSSMSGVSTLKKQDHSSSSQEPDRKSQISNVSMKKQTIRWHDGYVRSFPATESDVSVTVSSSSCSTSRSNRVQKRVKATAGSSSCTESSESESHASESTHDETTEQISKSYPEALESSTNDPSTSGHSRHGFSESTDNTSLEFPEELRQIAGAIQRLTTDFDMSDHSSCGEDIGDSHGENRPPPDRHMDHTPREMSGSGQGLEIGNNRHRRINHNSCNLGRNGPRWSTVTPATPRDDLPDKDEYFLVDGKSNDFPPGRGDNSMRAEKRIVSDGSIHSGPGLDRDPGVRAQFVPEAIGPGSPRRRVVSRRDHRAGAERDCSDSTDEYISTYRILRQRFRSWSD